MKSLGKILGEHILMCYDERDAIVKDMRKNGWIHESEVKVCEKVLCTDKCPYCKGKGWWIPKRTFHYKGFKWSVPSKKEQAKIERAIKKADKNKSWVNWEGIGTKWG